MFKKISNRMWLWLTTAIIGFTILFPLYWIFLSSITPEDMLFTTPINYIPLEPTLENYINLFSEMNIGMLIKDTGIIVISSVILSILIALMAGYAFARFDSIIMKIAIVFLVFTSMLPMVAAVIPMFQFFKLLKLVDTYFGVIILYTSNMIPFTTIVFVTFIRQIPRSLEEAAEVDGAGVFRRLFSILFPVLKPAIATMAIINFILGINEFMIPLIFTVEKIRPLSIGITLITRVNQYTIPWERISALATIMLVPIIIFVLVFEKNIMEGLMAGSLKQ